ncbi:MAG: TonB-dependent receptor plug domain-containing protein [Bacteroidales bacterium]
MKTVAFYTALLISLHLQGQQSFREDTILINEVVISRNTINPSPGFKITYLDSSILSGYNHRTLADLLSENSSIFVKSYGPGGIATPSFRGTGPGHTRISWNNINLNNPMLGQFDLSLVPAGFADDVYVSYGGGSMDINNGGLGGIVNIETKPDWDNGNLLFVNPGFGSFGRYSALARVRTGNAGFQSVTRAFLGSAENNFPYLNNIRGPELVWERRKSSQIVQRGFIQELYFKGTRNIFSTRLWYQSASRNLPVPLSMLSMDQGERQDDRSLRTLVSIESLDRRTDYVVSAAFVADRLTYTNRLASINSDNKAGTLIMKGVIMPEVSNLRLKILFDNELNFINSNNYQGKRTRNMASVAVSAETDFTEWLTARLLARETLQDADFLNPDLSLGAEIRILPGKDYFIKANLSKNSKIPTLNDMYWTPGGNPDLKNESGFITEIGLAISQKLSAPLTFRGEFTGFRNFINDMIQWYPGENSYWIAGNVKKITTAGIESEVHLIYSKARFRALADIVYTLTKARSLTGSNGDPGNYQLIYVPASQFGSGIRVNWRTLFSSVKVNYTGRRYLTADNSQYLQGYALSDLKFGVMMNSKNTTYDLSVIVDNLFNVSYQDIAWYPMPGRAFSLSIVFQLKK